MKFRLLSTGLLVFSLLGTVLCARGLDSRSRDPYYSAVVMDADSGKILWEDHAGAQGYPASMVKMMNAFVVFDELAAGRVSLDTPITVTGEMARIGGRQVWLAEGEVFSVKDLMYAMMVRSANDAAGALAIGLSGSREEYIRKMNRKAQELGLGRTEFGSVHGLPPGTGQTADVSTALDMARLARALMSTHPEILEYTSIRLMNFRDGQKAMVQMVNSNKLIGKFDGCDGLKTGYISAGGFSVTVTATRNGRRVIAVVMGCKSSKTRDQWANQLLERGFDLLPPEPPSPSPAPKLG